MPWRESCARVIALPESADGCGVCRVALAAALAATSAAPLRIGAFAAASNVTGVVEDVRAVTAQLHAAGCLSVWDFAAAASGADVAMNPAPPQGSGLTAADVAVDALFLSPHKLAGGPGAPGVLVVKRALLRRAVPGEPGGGTVFFVTAAAHSYVSNAEEREQGGTQDVVGACRAALALRVRASIGPEALASAAHAAAARVDASRRSNPRACVLGPAVTTGGGGHDGGAHLRLPTCSFLVRGPPGTRRWLHHGFVCALLNDLFGLQARGGCACAGPYGLSLLGVSDGDAAALERALRAKAGWAEALRPGWSRISFSWCVSDREIGYALAAVHAVADHGWRLLPQYRFNPRSGEWKARRLSCVFFVCLFWFVLTCPCTLSPPRSMRRGLRAGRSASGWRTCGSQATMRSQGSRLRLTQAAPPATRRASTPRGQRTCATRSASSNARSQAARAPAQA